MVLAYACDLTVIAEKKISQIVCKPLTLNYIKSSIMARQIFRKRNKSKIKYSQRETVSGRIKRAHILSNISIHTEKKREVNHILHNALMLDNGKLKVERPGYT